MNSQEKEQTHVGLTYTMQILHPFAGSVQQYQQQLADADVYECVRGLVEEDNYSGDLKLIDGAIDHGYQEVGVKDSVEEFLNLGLSRYPPCSNPF